MRLEKASRRSLKEDAAYVCGLTNDNNKSLVAKGACVVGLTERQMKRAVYEELPDEHWISQRIREAAARQRSDEWDRLSNLIARMRETDPEFFAVQIEALLRQVKGDKT